MRARGWSSCGQGIYDPGVGRFISKDPWPGSLQRPQSLNDFSYAKNNSINATDPLGLFSGPWEELPAWMVVEAAKMGYSKLGLLRNCFLGRNRDDGQWPSDTVDDLLTDYICEYGPEHRYFYADAHLTQQLARSISIHRIREEYYRGDYQESGQPLEDIYNFDNREFFEAEIDSLLRGDKTRFLAPLKRDITAFIGTYDYKITRLASNKVRFQVHNRTTLESGTRIPPIFGGVDPKGAEAAFSVEELLQANPSLASQSLGSIMDSYPIISILESKTRRKTTGPLNGLLELEGGGTMRQTFIWREQYPLLGCFDWLPPWPIVLQFLTIDNE
jgi:RHS repeat-associated protein